MAHSVPTQVLNRGTAWRVSTAGGCFIIELCADWRVQAWYEQWRRMGERGKRAIDRAGPRVRTIDDEAALKAWTDDFAALSTDATQHFVRDGLRVPYTWVAPCLDQCFRIRLHNENHPGDQKLFALHVFMPELAPKGQAPAHEGADLERRVRWYYRAEVKDPRDTVHEIAREYASEVHRTNDCRSVIQRGIASTDRLKARALLDSRE